jgi:hypothetical protein
MPVLANYTQFIGRHWETGSVANVLAYQLPAGEQPLSEAMLLGISGGAAFGYFVFDYKDTDPHVSLLSRNTFDPLDTFLERLAIPQDLYQTQDSGKAERNLIEILESGRPAIVWADMFSLPYNALSPDEQMWAMMPIVVYGYEDDMVHIADRASTPLTVSTEDLVRARARVKKDRFRVLALGAPDRDKLPSAIQKGIWQCIALYTEAPPKGGRDNFGFAAYEKLATMLTNTRNKQSWERLLPPGSRMYAALAGFGYQPGAFGWATTFPSNQVDDRMLYSEFLDESADILNKPMLRQAGEQFRKSSAAWRGLANAFLPNEVPLMKETRELLISKRDLFVSEGGAALDEIQKIDRKLVELRASAASEFPMSAEAVVQMRAHLADEIMEISDIERGAIDTLQGAMA